MIVQACLLHLVIVSQGNKKGAKRCRLTPLILCEIIRRLDLSPCRNCVELTPH